MHSIKSLLSNLTFNIGDRKSFQFVQLLICYEMSFGKTWNLNNIYYFSSFFENLTIYSRNKKMSIILEVFFESSIPIHIIILIILIIH